MLSSGKDISRLLREWSHDHTKVNVRRIIGEDGREKIQLRVDLGILQMELDGRPDGKRPFGKESLLEYYLHSLKKHKLENKTEDGFELSREDCLNLQQEALQYYHRYLSLFYLGDYESVVRDTKRNLKVFDLIKNYASDQKDKTGFEQFRPFVLMMFTRAKASIALKDKNYDLAITQVKRGVEQIEKIQDDEIVNQALNTSTEINFLQRWMKEISKLKPEDPIEKLERKMNEAVQSEDFELAAKLRDQLRFKQDPK